MFIQNSKVKLLSVQKCTKAYMYINRVVFARGRTQVYIKNSVFRILKLTMHSSTRSTVKSHVGISQLADNFLRFTG